MAELMLYGLDAAGEAVFTRRLGPGEREAFRTLADEHLKAYHTVEVWEGPLCILRLRRKAAEEA